MLTRQLCTLGLVFSLCLSFPMPFLQAQDIHRNKVFVLHSYSPDFIWTNGINRGIESHLAKDVDLTIEYLDAKQRNDNTYLDMLFQLYQYKYNGLHYDAIICSDDDALQFLILYGDRLFPNTPVVFSGVNEYRPSMFHLDQSRFTGALEDIDIKQTLNAALLLTPQARHLAVITDQTKTGIICKQAVQDVVYSNFAQLDTIFLDTLPLPKLLQTVQAYSDDTILLYLPFVRDINGNSYQPEAVAELISQNSGAPVFGLWDHFLNHGILGGRLTSGYHQGEVAASMVQRILAGESPASIPVISESPKDFLFDYQQLSRFNLQESNLPVGSMIINKPTSFYSEYTILVWITLTLFVSLVVIILLLSANVLIRRKALEATNKLAMMVESSDDAIISLSLDGTVQSWNNAAERIYGYTASEMIGQSIYLIVPPDQTRYMRDFIRWIGRGKKAKQHSAARICKDGSRIETSRTISPIKDDAGLVIGASIIARDVSELQRALTEIHRLNAELEQRVAERTAELAAANKELEAFCYSVSHDLRSPLRSIDGFSQALLEDFGEKLNDDGKNYLQRVRSASQRMGMLIDDLLKLSRVTRSEMLRRTVDFTALATTIADGLRKTDPTRQVEFCIHPGVVTTGDEALLRIALENLLDNAWKFTSKKPQALIEFGMCPSSQTDSRQTFFVRDNGAGFDMAYSDKLFGAFQRLHTNEEFTGTGIGLATVQRIVHRHGGDIWAEGQVAQGATIYFTL